MKKYDVKNKLEAYTIAFYNEMVIDQKKREFYRIVYYLYFLKKRDYYLFENDYKKTRTGIIWPDNEKLMNELIIKQQYDRQLLDCDKLTELDKKLVSDVYENYRNDSIIKLKQLVLDDIKSMEIFNNCSLQEQMDVVFKRFKELYEENPTDAINLLNIMFNKHNVPDLGVTKHYQKVLIPKKRVI